MGRPEYLDIPPNVPPWVNPPPFDVVVVPEPSTWLIGVWLLAFVFYFHHYHKPRK